MADRIQSEGSKALDQAEHNPDAGAKRVIVRAQDPGSGDFVNIGANDNGDGTFSLKTDATFSGSVNAVTEYDDGSSTVATPSAPGIVFDNAGTINFVSDTNPLPVDATVNASVDLGDQNTGNATAATQRVVLASDQPVIPVSDNGSSLTVDATSLPLPTGAATAANQQTDALTDTELRATPVPISISSGNISGFATSAKQDTIIGHIDGVEGLLTTIDGDTSALAGTITSNKLQVDVVTAPTTTVQATDLDIRNLTATDVVTANLSATDNAVLDQIELNQDAQTTLLTTIESNQLPDGHNVTIDNPGDIGGGVQYDEGDTDATPTGTVAMWRDSSDDSIVSVSDENPLPVSASIDTTGLATDTKQDAQTALLTDIEANQLPDGHNVTVDNASLAITAAALPLPTGAATSANQQTDALTDTELRATPVVVDLGSNNDVTVTSGTVTANLGAVDNAVLDQIEANQDTQTGILTTIDADTSDIHANTDAMVTDLAAIETLLATIEGNQLPDGHNVTVDNASIAVTGTFWQATQPISAASLPLPSGAATAANQQTDALTDTELRATPVPVSGTVTANLSATDNAVLDSIDEAVSSKQITSINHGVQTVTTAGTDVALASSTSCKRVTIMAQTDNTGVIAVGGSGVDATVATGTGILLFPGDAYELDIDNLADIFIDSSVNGEGVRYVWFN